MKFKINWDELGQDECRQCGHLTKMKTARDIGNGTCMHGEYMYDMEFLCDNCGCFWYHKIFLQIHKFETRTVSGTALELWHKLPEEVKYKYQCACGAKVEDMLHRVKKKNRDELIVHCCYCNEKFEIR